MRRVWLAGFLAISVATGSLNARSWAADEDLVGHWTFDAAAADSSGAGRHGTVHGAAAVEGAIGAALQFDGQDDYVALGDLGQHEAVTVAFWMKAADPGSQGWQGLVTSEAWEEGVLHIPVGRGVVDVYLHMGDDRRGRVSSSKLRPDTWYHVAVTADVQRRLLVLYVNGFEEAVDSIARLSTPIKLIGQVVGREFDGQTFSRFYRGAVDDVRIYRRALTGGEIQALCPDAPPPAERDPRNIRTGRRIPDEGYCDQPYVVVTKEGDWVCTLTTGPGREGDRGQHVVSTRSTDHGRSWSELVDIEPSDGPEASWVVPLITPGGRIYAFYTYNGDDVRTLGGKEIRADVHGWYAYRYSDDSGRSWSNERFRLPLRVTACDRTNDWQGEVQIFWGIDKPMVVDGEAVFAFTKLGKYMLDLGEGWFFRSENILTESDVTKLRWELLPEGDRGLRNEPFGSVQEEHNVVALDCGKLYCVYRTTTGYPAHAYSEDGGRTWTKPEWMTYAPGGRKMKTPRACPMLWRTQSGNFLFWYHHNNNRSFRGRNPVWISGGVERDGFLHWSQPEILLYDDNVNLGMSYPDLIEQDGRYWVTETNKTIARVHEIDPTLLAGLWRQGADRQVTRTGLLVQAGADEVKRGRIDLPKSLDLTETRGMAVDVWIRFDDLASGQVLLDSRDPTGGGIALTTNEAKTIEIELSDGKNAVRWDCDPDVIRPGTLHHVAVIVDAAPGVISFVVDGVLCDGGEHRNYGWLRYAADLGDVAGSGTLRLAPSLSGTLKSVRVYDRYLRTSEAIANFHAGG
jgi:hypothetical protein